MFTVTTVGRHSRESLRRRRQVCVELKFQQKSATSRIVSCRSNGLRLFLRLLLSHNLNYIICILS